MRWTGHVEREIKMSESISADISVLVVWEVDKRRGRGLKTLDKYVRQDISLLGLNKKDVLNKSKWRISIMIKSLTRIHY